MAETARLDPNVDLGYSCRITQERGPMTRQVRNSALAWCGEPAWERLLATVSPECRLRFQHPIGFFEWVESELALELHAAWAEMRGYDDMRQRGEDAARQMLGGAQRWLLRLASPAFLLQNASHLYGFYYRGGRMRLQHLEPGLGILEFLAEGYPDSWFNEGLSAWIRVALEMTGAKNPSVQYRPPQEPDLPLHRYEVSWA